MDELTLLRRVREDVAEPHADVLADARRQLTQRQLAPRPAPTTLRRRPPMRRRIVIAAATAAAVTGGLVALNTNGTSGHRAATPPPATGSAPVLVPVATLLDQAATRTLRAGDPTVAPGQYRDVRTHAWFSVDDGNNVYYLAEQRAEEWIPATEKGTWYWRYTRPIGTKFFSAKEEQYVRTHNPNELKTGVERYTGRLGVILTEHHADGSTSPAGDGIAPPDWGAPTTAWLATLPRDPGALLQRLYADAPAAKPGSQLDKYDFAFAFGDVLRSGLVPADLRAALYRAAAKIPDIKLIDSAANLDGRHGVAIGRVQADGQLRHDLVFDSAAGQLIGERDVVVRQFQPNVPVGTTVASTAFTVGITDKPGF